MTTQIPANKQKLLSAGRDVMPPKKKARALVNFVIVMDGPAWANPTLKRSSADRCYGV